MTCPASGLLGARDIFGHAMAAPPAAPDAAPRVLVRSWTTREGWRDTRLGMWAWLLQRAAAVALLGVIVLHLVNPFRRGVQAALLILALLHGLLGVRSLFLDAGLPLRWQGPLFVLALVLTGAIAAGVWAWRWY